MKQNHDNEETEALSTLLESFLPDEETIELVQMSKNDKITELTDQWYRLIGKDHHKDKDCHFYIQTEWSYGLPPKYWVLHYGYIIHDYEGEQYDSYEEAQDGLILFLQKIIKEETENQSQNSVDPSW